MIRPKTTSGGLKANSALKNLCSASTQTDKSVKLRDAMWADAVAYAKKQSSVAGAVINIPDTTVTGSSYCSGWRRAAGDFGWNSWNKDCTGKAYNGWEEKITQCGIDKDGTGLILASELSEIV